MSFSFSGRFIWALFAITAVGDLHAHGSMVVPESRVYHCFVEGVENPTDPACAAAIAVAGTQPFYDWMGINQANANGQHQLVVPDGTLCAGGNAAFAGLNLARDDWYANPIQPDAQGNFEFLFHGTAPHATEDWLFYVTRVDWDPLQPLRWSDLELFCSLGNTPLGEGNLYHLECPLPQRSGRHVIYNVWQRSDSTEAFYTCIDVMFPGDDRIFADAFD